MSLQGIRQNEYTDEAKASAALTVLNHDSFPCDLKLNSQQAILLSFCTVLYDCLKLKLVKKKQQKNSVISHILMHPVENELHKEWNEIEKSLTRSNMMRQKDIFGVHLDKLE